jgi:hypothetical protein
MEIPIEAVDFPYLPHQRFLASLDDLIWAAVTVGRPNRYYVFQHGRSSVFEIIFRASLVQMALEGSVGGTRFTRTAACKSLDPSEKGAINYFLGLTLCKAFAEKFLGTSWLWHLDVFRNHLNPTLRGTERSRPDLVGQLTDGSWISFEAKGRVSPPDAKTKQKAKEQAQRVIRVQGSPVIGHYAGISYFKYETLCFFVQDQEPISENNPKAIILKADERELFRSYYEPFFSVMRSSQTDLDKSEDGVIRIYSAEMDLNLGMNADLYRLAMVEQWAEIGRLCRERQKDWAQSELHTDGLWLQAGDSWKRRIKRSGIDTFNDE